LLAQISTDKSATTTIVTDATNAIPETETDSSSLKSSSSSKSNSKPESAISQAPVIAYAISITSCPFTDSSSSSNPSLIDGAAALAHSIHLTSIQNKHANKSQKSKYDYKLYAFIHTSIPSTSKCHSILKSLNYNVVNVDIPVPLEEIQEEYLKEKVPTNGCCGEKEFIKLWAYTLVDHPFVVHLDLDTMILKPFDELFDPILHSQSANDISHELDKVIMWKDEIKETSFNFSKVQAYFTRDYNMRKAGKKPVGVQGGFLIVRPSMEVFQQFQNIIRIGDFRNSGGWGGLGYKFYGAMTFQGIVPYYYDVIQPNTSIELHRCYYNNMADNPRDQRTVNNVVSGNCRDGRDDCEDCREITVDQIRTAHFTLCQKPWECLSHNQEMLQHKLCYDLFTEWYKIRADLELSWDGRSLSDIEAEGDNGSKEIFVVGNGSYKKEHFRGFCNSQGGKGYIPIELPSALH